MPVTGRSLESLLVFRNQVSLGKTTNATNVMKSSFARLKLVKASNMICILSFYVRQGSHTPAKDAFDP